MFIDQEWKKEQQKIRDDSGITKNRPDHDPGRQLFYYLILALIVIANVAGIGLFLYFKKTPPAVEKNMETVTETKATGTTASLPGDIGDNGGSGSDFSSSTANLKIEEITFGLFYRRNNEKIAPHFSDYKLPLNIKTDVSNYYDLSRRLELDQDIEVLNKNGFAILKTTTPESVTDFYGAHHYLADKKIPLLITSDFLFYYFQNTLKQVYKEIEKNAFYDNVWTINKKLYDIALTRYKKRSAQVGLANDPVLEAERLETAYFAVALKLLMPKEDQVNKEANFIDGNKFTEQDLDNYYFDIPAELKDDINKEYDLIVKTPSAAKSSVLLYRRDYTGFRAPANYRVNAKLNNFYLCMRWLNSVFPLYAKSDQCPDCLLDSNDWLINFIAANFIATDIYGNQDIKNEWAIVYKFVAFFNGLRKDLTYLQYYSALKEKYGESPDPENIFSTLNRNRESDIKYFQDKIAAVKYPLLEGGIDRSAKTNQPIIGMRMLQEPYWPNDYLFKLITGRDMVQTVDKNEHNDIFTGCSGNSGLYRCRGFGQDIINLIAPQAITTGDEYYQRNTAYTNYQPRITQINNEIKKFNLNSWNDNVYWLTLDLDRSLVTYDTAIMPSYASSDLWRETRDVNTALGGWVNAHLGEDRLLNYSEQSGSNLGAYTGCDTLSYVEPNLVFINDLIARNRMVIEILNRLNVSAKTNAANAQLKDLENILLSVSQIIKKEIDGQALNDDDCKTINDLARNYIVDNKDKKEYLINFAEKGLRLSINGVKLLALIYKKNDQNILVVGPVYNYSEK